MAYNPPSMLISRVAEFFPINLIVDLIERVGTVRLIWVRRDAIMMRRRKHRRLKSCRTQPKFLVRPRVETWVMSDRFKLPQKWKCSRYCSDRIYMQYEGTAVRNRLACLHISLVAIAADRGASHAELSESRGELSMQQHAKNKRRHSIIPLWQSTGQKHSIEEKL